MINQAHHGSFWNARASSAGDESDARAMEAILRQSDAFEEKEKEFRRKRGHVHRCGSASGNQVLKKWDEFIAHWDFENAAAFLVKDNAAASEIDIASQIKNRGAQSAAGVNANLPRNAHPFRLLLKFVPNYFQMLVGDLWFFCGGNFADAHFFGGVGAGESAFDRFAHDHAEEFQFEEGCVVVSFENTALAIATFSESHVVATINVSELGWECDLSFGQEGRNISPSEPITKRALLFGFVFLGEKAWHPEFPSIPLAGWGGVKFFGGFGQDELLGASGGRSIVDSKFGGALFIDAIFSETDLPKRGTWTLKQIGHALVCARRTIESISHFSCTKIKNRCNLFILNDLEVGAGEGNRTLVSDVLADWGGLGRGIADWRGLERVLSRTVLHSLALDSEGFSKAFLHDKAGLVAGKTLQGALPGGPVNGICVSGPAVFFSPRADVAGVVSAFDTYQSRNRRTGCRVPITWIRSEPAGNGFACVLLRNGAKTGARLRLRRLGAPRVRTTRATWTVTRLANPCLKSKQGCRRFGSGSVNKGPAGAIPAARFKKILPWESGFSMRSRQW